MIEILHQIDPNFVKQVLNYNPVYDFIIKNGTDQKLVSILRRMKNDYQN